MTNAVEAIITDLLNRRVEVQLAALAQLKQNPDRRAVAAVMTMIESAPLLSTVYNTGLKTLLEVFPPQGTLALVNALRRREIMPSGVVTQALNTVRDEAAIPFLVEALDLPNQSVNSGAAGALAAIGSPAIPILLDKLTTANPMTMAIIADLLGDIGDPDVFDELMGLLGHSHYQLRMAAINSLGQLGDKRAVEPLLVAYPTEALGYVRMVMVVALHRLGDVRAVPTFYAALRDVNIHVQGAAVDALGDYQTGLMQLLAVDNDTLDAHLRYRLALALGKIGDIQAVATLKTILKDRRGVGLSKTRVCDGALIALRQIGTAEALEAVDAWERR